EHRQAQLQTASERRHRELTYYKFSMSSTLRIRLRTRTSGWLLFDNEENALRSKRKRALCVDVSCLSNHSLIRLASVAINSTVRKPLAVVLARLRQSCGISNSVGGSIRTGSSTEAAPAASDKA